MAPDPLPPVDRRCVEPTRAQFAALGDLDAARPIVMLNLLRFREVADYSASPDLAPDAPVSGAEAYQRYLDAAQPHFDQAGGAIEHLATCGPTVIGPADERWDSMLLVRYPRPGAFVEMASTPEYRALAGHRTAALADSRLVPTIG